MKFSPATLRIQPGDTIVFKKNDLVPRTVTAKQRELFDSGLIKPGESWTFDPKFHATVPYVCTFHPMMEGASKWHRRNFEAATRSPGSGG